MKLLSGVVAMVTGASAGIGKAVAIALAEEGCNICALGRNEEKLRGTVDLCKKRGVKAVCFPLSMSETSKLKEAVDFCVRELGGIDILVNASEVGGCSDSSMEYMEKCLNVNLLALMKLTKCALPFIEKGTHGAVINIASSEGRDTCQFNHAPYVASKCGVVGFTGSLFEDVREKGIKVCSIEPELFISNGIEGESTEEMIQPEDVAKAVVFVSEFPPTACPTEIFLSSQKSPYKMVHVDA